MHQNKSFEILMIGEDENELSKMYQMIRRQFIKTLVNILIRMVSAPFAVRKIHIELFQQTKTYCL